MVLKPDTFDVYIHRSFSSNYVSTRLTELAARVSARTAERVLKKQKKRA
jgi:hypothetical protein